MRPFVYSIPVLAAAAGTLWFLLRLSPPPAILEAPAAIEVHADDNIERPLRVVASGGSLPRLTADPPLIVPAACQPDGLSFLCSVRLAPGSPGSGISRLVVEDSRGRHAETTVAWRRASLRLETEIDVRSPARPDSEGVAVLHVRRTAAVPWTLPPLLTALQTVTDEADAPPPRPAIRLTPGSCTMLLALGQSCSLEIRWDGRTDGAPQRISLNLDPADPPLEITLPSDGFLPDLLVLGAETPFFASPRNGPETRVLTLHNVGHGDARIQPWRTEGVGFLLANGDCPPTLPPGTSCHLQVSFLPATDGSVEGALVLGDLPPTPLRGQAKGFAPRLVFEIDTDRRLLLRNPGPVFLPGVEIRRRDGDGPFLPVLRCPPLPVNGSCLVAETLPEGPVTLRAEYAEDWHPPASSP